MLAVASSRMRTLCFFKRARARTTSCFWPEDRLLTHQHQLLRNILESRSDSLLTTTLNLEIKIVEDIGVIHYLGHFLSHCSKRRGRAGGRVVARVRGWWLDELDLAQSIVKLVITVFLLNIKVEAQAAREQDGVLSYDTQLGADMSQRYICNI
jgi:hypothetical protein